MHKIAVSRIFPLLYNCAAVGFSEITSANVVGYHQVTLKQGWNMLAVNWDNCGDTDGISIQDLIPGTTEGLSGNQDAAKADQIQIYNPTSGDYTIFTLFYTTIPNPGLQAKNFKWVESNGNVATYKFTPGTAFWFKKQGADAIDVSLSGQVSALNLQEVTIVNGWNMIASAFPVNFNPNTLGDFWKTCGAVGNQDAAKADQIQVYNPDTKDYTVYTLFYTTIPNPGLQAKNYKWVDSAGNIIGNDAIVIKPGNGVWYKHQGSGFKFSITSPIAK